MSSEVSLANSNAATPTARCDLQWFSLRAAIKGKSGDAYSGDAYQQHRERLAARDTRRPVVFVSYSGDCAAQSAVENGHLYALREPVTQMVDVALALHLGGTRAGSSLPSIGQTI